MNKTKLVKVLKDSYYCHKLLNEKHFKKESSKSNLVKKFMCTNLNDIVNLGIFTINKQSLNIDCITLGNKMLFSIQPIVNDNYKTSIFYSCDNF